MKQLLILFFLGIFTNVSYCQDAVKNDTIFYLNNEIVFCKVTNIS